MQQSGFLARQRGFSLIGFLFIGGLLAVLGVVGAQVLPTVIEYQTILKTVKKAATGATVVEVRNIFDKAAMIDEIHSITGKDLDVTKDGDQVVVSFAYDKEIHLTGPAYLVIKYSGKSK